MPFPASAYRNIPSTGIIPSGMVPADQISFAYSFTYQKNYDPAAALGFLLKGRVVLELKDALGQLKATFDLTEAYNIMMFGLGGGLVFYIWSWYSGGEKYVATDAEGTDLQVESVSSLPPDPPSGTGQSDNAAYIISKFYSPTFFQSIEEGDTLKIKFHNLSAGTVVAQASLQIATRVGDEVSPALVDEQRGIQYRVVTTKAGKHKQTRIVRSRTLDSPLEPQDIEWTSGEEGVVATPNVSGAQLDRSDSVLYVLGLSDKSLQLYQSSTEGKTWQQVMNEPTNIKILAARLASGGRYIVYGVGADKKPAYAILKHGAGGWTTSESGPCSLSPEGSADQLPTSKVSALEDGSGGVLRLLSTDKDGTLRTWLSRDGKSWSQSPVAS